MNSDSKQCTESKPGWVHRVHTQRTLTARAQHPGRAHGAVSWRALGRIVAPSPAVLRAPPCHVAHWRAVPQPPCPQYKNCIATQSPCRACCRACRSAPAPCRSALLRYIATQRSPPSAMIQNFVSRPYAS